MIDRELASIIRYVLDSTGNPAPYYWKVPENFVVPAAYFPPPEIISGPDTFNSYKFDYAWYILLFHKSDQDAYVMGREATDAIRRIMNLIPRINEDGETVNGKYVRVSDPRTVLLENGACQLTIEWTSRKPYEWDYGTVITDTTINAYLKTTGEED